MVPNKQSMHEKLLNFFSHRIDEVLLAQALLARDYDLVRPRIKELLKFHGQQLRRDQCQPALNSLSFAVLPKLLGSFLAFPDADHFLDEEAAKAAMTRVAGRPGSDILSVRQPWQPRSIF